MTAQDSILVGSAHPPTSSSSTVSKSDEEDALIAKANEAIYKQNFELSIRNKTLLVLHRLSDITIRANSVTEVSQLIVDTIVSELNFAAAIVSLVDKQANVLRPVAITKSPQMLESLKLIGKPLEGAVIPLDDTHNLTISAIRDVEQKVTDNILDLLTPLINQDTAAQIGRITNIKTIIIYPLFLGERALGTLALGLTKTIENLSRAEKETLSELISIVTIAIDRAELLENIQKTNNKLQVANEKLEQLDKLKDEFVSLTSHELRTPLTAIKSYAWLVLNNKAGPLEPKAHDYLNRVFVSTERLIHLVNEMLDISRIESGKVQLKKELVDMKLLAQDVQSEFQPKCAEQHVTLTAELPDTIPSVTVDREKIHQVLENIVGNAFKFTPSGGSIHIIVTPKEETIEVSVVDTGKGIYPEDMKKLFIKFGRLEGSYITIIGTGSGLGLYICKQYIELHGGKIWATSDVGKGSTFTFTLPTQAHPLTLQSEGGTLH